MTPQEVHDLARELRVVSTNVLGFQALMEDADDFGIPTVRRIIHQAQFTANAVRMAVLAGRLADLLSDGDST
jgi:hypothetical protein